MGALSETEFGGVFNSPLEAGIRAVVVLEHLRPETLDLAEMVLFDHVVVHTADLGGPPSLHPEVPGRKGELLVRRRLVEASLQLMQRCHLVDQESADEGIVYRASEEAAAYVELLETTYSVQMKSCARWLAEQVQTHSKAQFKQMVRPRPRNYRLRVPPRTCDRNRDVPRPSLHHNGTAAARRGEGPELVVHACSAAQARDIAAAGTDEKRFRIREMLLSGDGRMAGLPARPLHQKVDRSLERV